MFIVTGGAGFIGSNIVKMLNDKGYTDILVVDHLKAGHKFINLSDLDIADYMEGDDFIRLVQDEAAFNARFPLRQIKAIFHEGACSSTTEWDGQYIMRNNYEYTKTLFEFASAHGIPFLYASSAATYGGGSVFVEDRKNEGPLNVYGYSKFLFDQYLRRRFSTLKSQVAGFRYFNVYGPREGHKGTMASVAFHLYNQMQRGENLKLFKGCMGYPDGGQMRDFVYVEDVCKVLWWFYEHPDKSGIFNCGTGRAEPFLNIAKAVLDFYKHGQIEFIPFPQHLVGHYQCFTQADLTKLRAAGCDVQFRDVATGTNDYLTWLTEHNK